MKIEGYFSKIKTANETADKLKGLGLKRVIVKVKQIILGMGGDLESPNLR